MNEKPALGRECAIVMGIDPGLGATGWAVVSGGVDSCELLAAGAIRTDARAAMAERLLVICNRVRDLVANHGPADVAIEDVFLAKDARAAFALGQARGAAIVGAALANRLAFSYTALQVKQSVTGHGRASKEQVGYMVRNMLHLEDVLQPMDASDAAAVAICHWMKRGSSGLTEILGGTIGTVSAAKGQRGGM